MVARRNNREAMQARAEHARAARRAAANRKASDSLLRSPNPPTTSPSPGKSLCSTGSSLYKSGRPGWTTRRRTPCVNCVRSAIAGRSTGECFNTEGAGARCWRCSHGHSCCNLPKRARRLARQLVKARISGTPKRIRDLATTLRVLLEDWEDQGDMASADETESENESEYDEEIQEIKEVVEMEESEESDGDESFVDPSPSPASDLMVDAEKRARISKLFEELSTMFAS